MNKRTIAVVGLGYVGLPLVIEFGKLGPTIGFDISKDKIDKCIAGQDPSRELTDVQMASAIYASYTNNAADLNNADVIIVAVPTPVDRACTPDFAPLISASACVARNLKRGALVIYESTVYPGATEEICIPVLERESGMAWRKDFFVGYSPERINPGDKEHTLRNVLKIVAGDTSETLNEVAKVYESIIVAGVHKVSSIKAAEAAKVIENTQRDLNIALMNELAVIFEHIGLDTTEVLEAAGTKWNFLKFKPGLVGGHCIGVDPYYLTYKAESMGYHPQVILAGRRINDSMGKYIAEQTIKQMIANGSAIRNSTVNILGFSFKENCADLRNTKVIDIIRELCSYGVRVFVSDPAADLREAKYEYGIDLVPVNQLSNADALILAVAHTEYSKYGKKELYNLLKPNGVVVDVKACLPLVELHDAGYRVWRL